MGLIESSVRTGASYLSIADGKLIARAKTQLEGYEPYTKKDGTIGFEKKFKAVEGFITGVARVESEWGPKWEFTLHDDGVRFIISLNYSSSYAKNIINCLCNPACDLTQRLTIKPWSMDDPKTGKAKTGVNVKQNAVKIPWAYGLDDMPRLEQVTVKGMKVWDDTKQVEFLENAVETVIRPRILPF